MAAGALAGVEMFSARLSRVVFFRCKFDSVNLRAAKLNEVSFVDCKLRDLDLSGATLTNVTFPGSTLEAARMDKARMTNVDLRGLTTLEIVDGVDGLAGATITTTQLVDLAGALAQAAGITVKDG
jgi:uncharacterized protein YjbI with pentapeptide repeats